MTQASKEKKHQRSKTNTRQWVGVYRVLSGSTDETVCQSSSLSFAGSPPGVADARFSFIKVSAKKRPAPAMRRPGTPQATIDTPIEGRRSAPPVTAAASFNISTPLIQYFDLLYKNHF
jgi:hypothetical protein